MGTSLLDPLRALRNAAPVPYTSRRQGFGGRRWLGRPSGQEAQMRAQGGNGTLYAIVDRIITGYSQVDWHLYRKAKSGKKEDRTEVTNHAVLDLWNRPNPFTHGMEFREAGQQHRELTGEKWWVCVKHPASNMPLELWVVRPDRMRPVPHPEKFLTGYEYVGPDGEVVPLRLDEVIFQRSPNPLDPYRGLGPVQTILTDLDSSRYSREWNRQFFMNSAEPGGIIEVDQHLSDDEFHEARDRWQEQHQGVQAAHRVAILENGLKWVDRTYTNRDMQFTELAAQSRETIREAFGFPKPLLGAVDDVNRANADAADVVFARWLLVSRLKRERSVLNNVLLPMYGPRAKDLEFDFENPVPEDLESEAAQLTSRANAAAVLRDAGWAPDDCLSTAGLPPMRYEAPAGPPLQATTPAQDPAAAWRAATAGLTTAQATTWKVSAHEDADICKPCSENDGHVYATQADAYADYPGGKGYIKCLGKSNCRCVVKEES